MRATRSVLVAAPEQRLLSVILDFAAYPAFLPEIQSAVLLEGVAGAGDEWTVRFHAEVVRALSYTLRLWRAGDGPDGTLVVRWSLVEGALFRVNEGSWTLRAADGGTLATYDVQVELGVFVPTSLVASLTGSSLPRTLDAFRARAERAERASRG